MEVDKGPRENTFAFPIEHSQHNMNRSTVGRSSSGNVCAAVKPSGALLQLLLMLGLLNLVDGAFPLLATATANYPISFLDPHQPGEDQGKKSDSLLAAFARGESSEDAMAMRRSIAAGAGGGHAVGKRPSEELVPPPWNPPRQERTKEEKRQSGTAANKAEWDRANKTVHFLAHSPVLPGDTPLFRTISKKEREAWEAAPNVWQRFKHEFDAAIGIINTSQMSDEEQEAAFKQHYENLQKELLGEIDTSHMNAKEQARALGERARAFKDYLQKHPDRDPGPGS